jgi:hypothetical protein
MERMCLNLARRGQVWFLIVGFVLVLGIGCQEQNKVAEKPEGKLVAPKPPATRPGKVSVPETNEAAVGGPKIMFEQVVYDFGDLGPGMNKTAEFKFTNAGDGLLKITGVEGCCGVVTRLNKKEYAPGESGKLEADYRSSLQPGVMRRQIHVNSNDKATPRVELTVEATIVQKVSFQPDRLNLLLKSDANCPSITLTSLDGKPFSIKQFKSTGNCITADVNSLMEATKFVIQPKIDVEKLRRGLSGVIEISLTHPECDTVAIPFNALPVFEVNPPMIIVFNAEPQNPVERDLWVLNNYGADFEIESTSSQNNYIAVSSRQKIHNGYQFKLAITPPAVSANQRNFTDVFSVNIKGGEKLIVTCRGFYQQKR